jgi:predicted nucleic acid-binding protein
LSVVLDASLTLVWCFKDESTPHTNAVLQRVASDGAVVPSLRVYEVANALVAGRRKNPPRIHDSEIEQFLQALATMPIRVLPGDSLATTRAVFELAKVHSLSAYDAAYLDAALSLGLPLGTLDGVGKRQGLKQAAEKAGVPLLRVG